MNGMLPGRKMKGGKISPKGMKWGGMVREESEGAQRYRSGRVRGIKGQCGRE